MPGTCDTEKRKALDTLMRIIEAPHHIGLDADGEPIAIQLFQRSVTDVEMECFRPFTEFESIGVGECSGVTDLGLAHIAHLKKLIFLDLQETSVTDAGLIHLCGLSNLRTLDLTGTKLTDAGVQYLVGLTGLTRLFIDEHMDGISDAAYYHLLDAIPGLSISNGF